MGCCCVRHQEVLEDWKTHIMTTHTHTHTHPNRHIKTHFHSSSTLMPTSPCKGHRFVFYFAAGGGELHQPRPQWHTVQDVFPPPCRRPLNPSPRSSSRFPEDPPAIFERRRSPALSPRSLGAAAERAEFGNSQLGGVWSGFTLRRQLEETARNISTSLVRANFS